MSRRRRWFVGSGIFLLALLALWLGYRLRPRSQVTLPALPPRSLVVAYLNVGHGEASWVKTPDGRFLVIGAGPQAAGAHVVESLKAAGARQIDLLVLPYPYSEALGGATELIKSFPIKSVLDLGWERLNQRQEETLALLLERKVPVLMARTGVAFDLGHGGRVEVLHPSEPLVSRTPAAANNSIVLRLSWGKTHFLWEGGLEEAGEQALLARGYDLTADVLRVARFGNAGASSPELLRQVQPRFVVVSSDDRSGRLPASKTLERLTASGAILLSTDRAAEDFYFFSDGQSVELAD